MPFLQENSEAAEEPMDTSQSADNINTTAPAIPENMEPEPERPSMDFFKAIFGSEDENDESEESSEEETSGDKGSEANSVRYL